MNTDPSDCPDGRDCRSAAAPACEPRLGKIDTQPNEKDDAKTMSRFCPHKIAASARFCTARRRVADSVFRVIPCTKKIFSRRAGSIQPAWIVVLVLLILHLRDSSRAYVSRFLLVDRRDDRDHPRGAAARNLRGSAANANSAREHLNLKTSV